MKIRFFCFLSLLCFSLAAEPKKQEAGLSVSTNPSTVNIVPGTGELGELIFRRDQDSGVRLGGVLLTDADITFSNSGSKNWSGNNVLVLGLDLNFDKLNVWKGGSFGISYLQFNGMDSNGRAGVVQGFDSLSVVPPYDNRSQLYEVWIRQELFDKKLIIRIGKTVPTYDFNNVIRPVPVQDQTLAIPGVSSLLFSPIFINPVNIGVMPGYYNSAYGITVNIAPTDQYYISLGAYDGNGARGVQTGLKLGPHFNGYYFCVAETGVSWFAGKERKPGNIGVGGWVQTGKLQIPKGASQYGAQGAYFFGSQRVWFKNPGVDDSGISVYAQLGLNHAKTLPMNRFIGGGFTAFALTRPKDSFGFGVAWSQLNHRLFTRKSELMFQAYYQAFLVHNTYVEPVISYIPTPGGGVDLPQRVIGTVQMITLF